MTSKQNYFTRKQRLKFRFEKRGWTTLLIVLNILFSLCESGDAITLQLDLPGKSQGKINLQCSIIQDDSVKIDENNSELCNNATIDAIITYKDETLVFKGDKYWRQGNNGLAPGYPKLISQKWPGLPSNISTAFTDIDGKYIYFFKGSEYWKYDDGDLKEAYPKDIKKDFPGLPNDLQASLIWGGDNELYLFKGDFYWKVNMYERPYDVSDEKAIKEWSGIPGNLDAALPSFGSVTYFFKGGKYYKYDDKSQSVVAEDPPYPRRVASNWFGCSKEVRIIED